MKTFIVFVCLAFAASAEIAADGTGENEYEKRYVVFPGLDATAGEVAEWATGWSTPFNVFFGPKPYVFGWIGEGGSFAPDDPDISGDDDDDDEEDEDDDSNEDGDSDEDGDSNEDGDSDEDGDSNEDGDSDEDGDSNEDGDNNEDEDPDDSPDKKLAED